MADAHSLAHRPNPSTPPKRIPHPPLPNGSPLQAPDSLLAPPSFKNGHLNLDTFSPVNQNGSFEFDRVIKSGMVHRRIKKKGAWKPSWKSAFLVLRPNLLSIYQSDDETGLRASITLSDVTAVAPVKKMNTEHVFGVFSPSKNYHFQGLSSEDAADWIERIRLEARVESRDELILASQESRTGRNENHVYETTDLSVEEDVDRPSSPDLSHWSAAGQQVRSRASTTQRQPSYPNEPSGADMMTSYSDFSDPPVGSVPESFPSSLPPSLGVSPPMISHDSRPIIAQTASHLAGLDVNADPERVIRQGWLQCLKTKGGVRQWKNLWVVLRPKTLTFYKNEQEYSAVKLVTMSSIINAAEIDPISKNKRFCMQIILEDKTFRFCAPDEDALASWLGSLKSVLAKRQEAQR